MMDDYRWRRTNYTLVREDAPGRQRRGQGSIDEIGRVSMSNVECLREGRADGRLLDSPGPCGYKPFRQGTEVRVCPLPRLFPSSCVSLGWWPWSSEEPRGGARPAAHRQKSLTQSPSPLLREVREPGRRVPTRCWWRWCVGVSHGKCLVHVDGDVDMICFAVYTSSTLGS